MRTATTSAGTQELDPRQVTHRARWESKETVRRLYEDYHRQLLDSCPAGPVLDIGAGTAHVKALRRDVICTDILWFPGIDVVADAHRLPFCSEAFSGVVMLDVLHHLERPIEFLKEASRVLRPGGRIAMTEPAMTTVARRFYDRYHEEPVEMQVDPFAQVVINPDRDPFDANQAIPTLLFASDEARKRVEREVPSLRVCAVEWHSLLAYPLSGGFRDWCLMPASLVTPMLRIERSTPEIVKRHFSFRMTILLEKL